MPDEYSWARAIVAKHFAQGLERLSDAVFVQQRYGRFESEDDAVYARLLNSLNDPGLTRTFVSYWKLGQALASQSRVWLDGAIADILIEKARRQGRMNAQIYTQQMLGHRWLDAGIRVEDIGDEWREQLVGNRPWRQQIHADALAVIDELVGRQERERVDREGRSKMPSRRVWDEMETESLISRDRDALRRIAKAMSGPQEEVTLHCNLLIIEPPRLDTHTHVDAIRFSNSKVLASHAVRKQERVNLLRVYAFLVQHKLLHDPTKINVRIAPVVPRLESAFARVDRYPDYFTAATYWSADQLWEFIGIPFGEVELGITDAATHLRAALVSGFKSALQTPSA